jgi:hypothetical protein
LLFLAFNSKIIGLALVIPPEVGLSNPRYVPGKCNNGLGRGVLKLTLYLLENGLEGF